MGCSIVNAEHQKSGDSLMQDGSIIIESGTVNDFQNIPGNDYCMNTEQPSLISIKENNDNFD